VYSYSGGGGVIWRAQLRLAHDVLPAQLVVSCIGTLAVARHR